MVYRRPPEFITRLADGTVKQLNPFTGTEVWTVPGRGHRPLVGAVVPGLPLDAATRESACAFCAGRQRETPPEKTRVVREASGWRRLDAVAARELDATRAEFRRIQNLFEILSFDYWRANYGYQPPAREAARKASYLADDEGLAHVLHVVEAKLAASGLNPEQIAELTQAEKLERASGFFGGGHDVIVARRHFAEDATTTAELASSGTLTPDEHAQFVALTIDAMRDLYEANPYVRYVSAFQNWLKPAGASFDHLHKQLVAIDEHGVQLEQTLDAVRQQPNAFNEHLANYAIRRNLTIAENEHALLIAGWGHRYPTLEVLSKTEDTFPWQFSDPERRGFSDLLHAAHAATGAEIPCNEEWHHRPMDADVPMPLRVLLKWRISTLAGFEGATKIYVNTVEPAAVRERVLGRLATLRDAGMLGEGIALGDEVSQRPNPLRYLRG